jgi:Domain of unknown function (DUF4160)
MPTVFREGKYRFFFYSKEGNEPPHVHVTSGDGDAKFWLVPQVELASSHSLNKRELGTIEEIISQHYDELINAWDEHFSK